MEAALAAVEGDVSLGAVVRCDPGMGRTGALNPGRGPFAGVPFLGKDLGSAAKGLATAGGSAALRRRLSDPARDSALFGRFRAGGLVPFGLTTVPEFGLALASDPARMVGLKPSRGAVPGGPDFGNHLMGLASELVLARSVRDVTTAFRLVSGRAQTPCGDPVATTFSTPVKVALCLPDRCGPDQQAAARAAALALESLGARVEDRPAPDAWGATAARLARMVLTASLAEWMASAGVADDGLSPIVAAIAAGGRALPATALFAASREMAQLSCTVWQMFEQIDVLLSPVLAGTAPALGAFDMRRADPAAHFARMEATAPNAALANVAGCPALVLPFGTDAAGLPLGVQLMGPIGSDLALLALAARLAALAPPVAFPAPIAGHP